MATESPLIHDGSQTTAAADLSASQYCFVKITAARAVNICTAGSDQAYGVLQNKPTSGLAADVGLLGPSKIRSGAAYSAGAKLMSDGTGRAILATSTNLACAIAIEASTGADQLVTATVMQFGKQ